MKIKIFPLFLITIFFSIFVIFYKGLQSSNIYSPNLITEKNIPLFKAKILDTENEISSEKIFKQDKFYLVNIWSSWCIPCREEHTFLIDLGRQKNIEIIGINYKDNSENALNFLKDLSNPYELILIDKDGILAIDWGAYGVPETFLVYKKKIIKKIIGPLNKNSLLEIKRLTK